MIQHDFRSVSSQRDEDVALIEEIAGRVAAGSHECARTDAARLAEGRCAQGALDGIEWGYPPSYVLGAARVLGLRIGVTPDVLVPGGETALLARCALLVLGSTIAPTVVDLGSGSGVLSLCVGRFHSTAEVTGIDISPEAVDLARRNALELGVSRVRFRQGDCRRRVTQPRAADVVMANPPYVATPALASIPTPWRVHTPQLAVDGGDDGLELIQATIDRAEEILRPGGYLLLEHDHGQAAAVSELLATRGVWWPVRSVGGRINVSLFTPDSGSPRAGSVEGVNPSGIDPPAWLEVRGIRSAREQFALFLEVVMKSTSEVFRTVVAVDDRIGIEIGADAFARLELINTLERRLGIDMPVVDLAGLTPLSVVTMLQESCTIGSGVSHADTSGVRSSRAPSVR